MKNYYVLLYRDNHFVSVSKVYDNNIVFAKDDKPKSFSKDDAVNLTDKLRKIGHQAFMSELPYKNCRFDDYVSYN